MKDRDFYTKASQKPKVTRTIIEEFPDGSVGRPSADKFGPIGKEPLHHRDREIRKAILEGETIWRLTVFYRTGPYEECSFDEHYISKKDAEAAGSEYPVGAEYDPEFMLKPNSKEFGSENLSVQTVISVMGRGEPPYFLIHEVLEGAGVEDEKWRLSTAVLSWIGESGKSALRERFGENWQAVAALEYCVKHFDQTSLATLAARVGVSEFIATDNYDAGYSSRELQLRYGGVQEIAMRSMQTWKQAGAGGGTASKKRRSKNLEALMQELERLSDTVDMFSEDRIFEQAIESAQEREPKMPQSKKTLDDYGTALRSEEPFKSR